jgi:hypothetical protein
MSMSCGIFVQFFKCEILMSGKFVSFIASCTLCLAVEAEGVIRRRLRNNWEDDYGFEFLRNWLTFIVIVVSWILYTSVHGKSIQVLREIFAIFWLCKFTWCLFPCLPISIKLSGKNLQTNFDCTRLKKTTINLENKEYYL